MTDDNDHPNHISDNLPMPDPSRLMVERDELVHALRETVDPIDRAVIADRLRAVSNQLFERLSKSVVDTQDGPELAAFPATNSMRPAYKAEQQPENPSEHSPDLEVSELPQSPGIEAEDQVAPAEDLGFVTADYPSRAELDSLAAAETEFQWPSEPESLPNGNPELFFGAGPHPTAFLDRPDEANGEPESASESEPESASEPEPESASESHPESQPQPPVDLEPVDAQLEEEHFDYELGEPFENESFENESLVGEPLENQSLENEPSEDPSGQVYELVPLSAVEQPEEHFDPEQQPGISPSGQPRYARPSGPALAVVAACLAILAGVLLIGGDGPTTTESQALAPAGPQTGPEQSEDDAMMTNIRAVIQGLGLESVVVDYRDGVIRVGGAVPTQSDRDSATTAIAMLADTVPVDASGLVVTEQSAPVPVEVSPEDSRSELLQQELDRVLAATPIIFGNSQTELTELHRRILNNIALILDGYPDIKLTIAGFADGDGADALNQGLSLSRANNVRDYMTGQGLPADRFVVEARGETNSSGAAGLAGLERRVEFEVGQSPAVATEEDLSTIRVAIVAPSASNDLAFTQSMVDAIGVLSAERSIELDITDNTFVPEEAAAVITAYAEDGFNLIIAHGSQFGASLIDIAPRYPTTAFAWGTASDTFGLANVYAYDAAAEEGGFVLGALAALKSENGIIGVVGPIEVGDAFQYISGFRAGALSERPEANVRVSYTGSFSDIGLASEVAQGHLDAGASVLTGSAQMVVGAIAVAEQSGALWFGTQSNQAALAPANVVASQVYHWEVALRPILADLEAGALAGTTYTANLANGGLVIEYNPDYPLDERSRVRADQYVDAIINGSIEPLRLP